MSESASENRHAPTQSRLQQALSDGNFARSNQLASLIFCVGAFAVMLMFGDPLLSHLRDVATVGFAQSPITSGEDLATASSLSLWNMTMVIAPLLLMFVGVVWLAHAWQSKFRFFPNRLSLDFDRIHPTRNLGRVFSVKTIWNAFIGLTRMLCVLGFGLAMIWTMRDQIGLIGMLPRASLVDAAVEITLWILGGGLALMLLFGIIDWLWQVKSHEASLRMNDQQMRDDLKSTEGDPQIKSRQRTLREQLVR